MFAQRFLGLPQANIASCQKEIYGEKVVLTSQKTILETDQHFLTAVLSEMD